MTKQTLFVFGLGFTGLRFAQVMRLLGWEVSGSVTSAEKSQKLREFGINAFAMDDTFEEAVQNSTHILSTVPPQQRAADESNPDPILQRFTPSAAWIAYLSTTGVYGDHDGAWVNETTPATGGTNQAREIADAQWREHGATIFRLPGIYGPGRSALERAEKGALSRIDKAGHVFSRIHVDDIVQALVASALNPHIGGIFNVADDAPTPQHVVEDYACELLGIEAPPLVAYEDAALSPRGRQFYSQCRRVANTKIKEAFGLTLLYPTYKEGLRSCLAARHIRV
ncbi:MAG: SDR family oxidoreductase [Pseudomonadota bacterium]